MTKSLRHMHICTNTVFIGGRGRRWSARCAHSSTINCPPKGYLLIGFAPWQIRFNLWKLLGGFRVLKCENWYTVCEFVSYFLRCSRSPSASLHDQHNEWWHRPTSLSQRTALRSESVLSGFTASNILLVDLWNSSPPSSHLSKIVKGHSWQYFSFHDHFVQHYSFCASSQHLIEHPIHLSRWHLEISPHICMH